MPRKPRVQRSAEEKFAIVVEGLKSGNIAETCRNHQIAATLYYRWKDDAEKASLAALGGKAQRRGLMPSRRNGSSSWNERWAVRTCRLRS